MAWSVTNEDVRTVKLVVGDTTEILYKDNTKVIPHYDSVICIEHTSDYNEIINNYVLDPEWVNQKFKVYSYCLEWSECTNPVASSRQDLIDKLNALLSTSSIITIDKNGTLVGAEPAINFIEGSNITITAVDDPTNNKVDITIDASGGGGGGVTAVTGTSPISSTGGTTPDISIAQADSAHDGYLSSTDWNTFNGKVDSVTATGLLTSSGGTTPDISSSVGKGKLVGRNSITAGIMEEISVGSGLTLSGTTLSANPVVSAPVYLVAHDENTQTAATRDTGYPMSIDWIDEANDITINAHTQITFNQDGVYNIQFSAQFTNNDTQFHDVDVWFKKNTSDIPWTNSRFTITGTHGGDSGHHIAAWNYMATFNTGDFVEIYWETDDTQVVIEKIPAAHDAPDTPSIILTVDKL